MFLSLLLPSSLDATSIVLTLPCVAPPHRSVSYPKVSFRDVIPALLPRLSALPKKEGSAAANKAEDQSDQQRQEALTAPTPEVRKSVV